MKNMHRTLTAATALLALCSISAAQAQIFVVNSGSGRIGEYTTSGAPIHTSLITGLNNPAGLVVSGGDIFVANAVSAGTIGEYTTAGATVNASLITGLNYPLGLAISGGDIYVANGHGTTIGEYTTSGATVNASLITGLDDPYALAVSGGDIFVANTYPSGEICEYTTSGATVNAALITGLDYPWGVVVESTPDETPTVALLAGALGGCLLWRWRTSATFV